MKWLKYIWKQVWCDHKNLTWVRNIYGDEINARNGKRSEWVCDQCGKIVLNDYLHQRS